MPKYRLIGYYEDNDQVYDSYWDGEDSISAVRACLHTLNDHDGMHLLLVAILDEAGKNVYEPDICRYLTDFDYEGFPATKGGE